MQLAKSIMLKKNFVKTFFFFFFLLFSSVLLAQNNSPYSRFGLGDIYPTTSVNQKGMGGISAGYVNWASVNFNNPASYSRFPVNIEPRSKKLAAGRVIFDAGVNLDNRSLIAPNTPQKFTASDLLFSYLQLGMPIKKNWGISFGLRPLTRVGYMINRYEQLRDPNTGLKIDSAITQFRGSGGSFLPAIGTGFGFDVGKNNFISFGINAGYLFGNRENTTFRSLINDTLLYYSSDHTTKTSFNSLFFNAGIQYEAELNKTTLLRFGFSGNWKQNLEASQDVLRQTFTRGSAGEELRIDSVYENKGIKGTLIYPSSYTAGFMVQRNNENGSGWMWGADLTQTKWSQYRFYGQMDSVRNNWVLNAGGQISPRPRAGYFSRAAYRFGLFAGQDYIKVQNKLPLLGASFGISLPVRQSPMARGQISFVNLALEYMKRGNNNNLLKENLFRISLGFNLTDVWFEKRKYD